MVNILYLSSHSILEFDEISLFTELGFNVLSLGAYTMNNQGDGTRNPIDNLYSNDHLRSVAMQCSKENIHPELLEWMDFCVMMHNARVSVDDHPQPWLKGNWKKIKASKKPCVWRGIGQSNGQVEQALQEFRKDGLKIVRHSPTDATIPHYAGSDAVIRFYKNPDEFKEYNGQNPRIINISQALFGDAAVRSRGDHMSLDFFKQVVDEYNWTVFGPNNDAAGEHNGGSLPYDDLKQMLRFNRVYFYVGTRPANYTLGFIEAMMTGIPVVSIGPEHGNEVYTDQKTFEAHELLGDAGYWSDSATQLRKQLAELLNNQQLAMEIGQKGRARAIDIFGKQRIRTDWENFFTTL